MRRAHATALALVAVAVMAAAGCGGTSGEASLTVSRDYGSALERKPLQTPVTPGLTAMRQLQAHNDVTTSFGGRYVDAINGVKSDPAAGEDWLYYVDGVQLNVGAASWRVKDGEEVLWDLHNWRDFSGPEAIVAAFPRPLSTHGVKVICRPNSSEYCGSAERRLKAAGADAAATGSPVNVVIGKWDEIAGESGVPDLTAAPVDGGAYASFRGERGALKLRLLRQDGGEKTLGAGAGLVAAARKGDKITWIVTGVDDAGVAAAAAALTTRSLKGAFAVATDGTQTMHLPLKVATGQ